MIRKVILKMKRVPSDIAGIEAGRELEAILVNKNGEELTIPMIKANVKMDSQNLATKVEIHMQNGILNLDDVQVEFVDA